VDSMLKRNGPHVRIFVEQRTALIDYAFPIVGCRAHAEDVVQEAYIRFDAANGKPSAIDNPVGYLFRIVRNLAIDRIRRQSLERSLPNADDLDSIPSLAPDAEKTLLYRNDLRRLSAALEELPARTRDAFLMHRVEGLSLQEIADRLSISVARAHQLVRKAMVHGAKRLDNASE